MLKKFFPYILIVSVATISVFAPLGAEIGYAQNTPQPPNVPEPDSFTCVPWKSNFTVEGCGAMIFYYIIFVPTSAILWVSGQIFNASIAFSLSGDTMNADMITDGWGIVRDVVNIFFIFILLYIAIATILDISGYGMKELLVKVIIIALLVNFSLLITKVIIDASNILALEFYDAMSVQGGTVTAIVAGNDAKDISAVFMDGFDPERLFNTDSFRKWMDKGTVAHILLIYLFAGIINIIATFILFSAALLFIIRVAILWLIMILAPLGFVAVILPRTRNIANKWWNTLFSQALFAPAFLFLFYLVAKLINDNFVQSMIASAVNTTSGMSGLEGFFAIVVLVFLHFTVLAVLLTACLVVAKSMGAYGSNTAMAWGSSARKWAQGYAGKIAARRFAPLAREIESGKAQQRSRYNPMRYAMTVARTVGKGAVKVPGVRTGLQSLGARYSKDVSDRQKSVEQFNSDELARRITTVTLPVDRAAIMNELAKRGDINKLSDSEIKRGRNLLVNVGMPTKDIDKLRPDFVEEKEKRDKAIKSIMPADIEKMNKETIEKMFKDTDMRGSVMASFSPAHYEKMKKDAVDSIFKQKEVVDDAVRTFGSNHAKKLLDIGGEAEKQFFSRLALLGDRAEDVAKKIEEMGNRSLASWVRSGLAAETVLKSYRTGSQGPDFESASPGAKTFTT